MYRVKKISCKGYNTNVLNQRYPISRASLCVGVDINKCMILSRKASIGMYSGCDQLSLQILFVYFLALPSLLHPSMFLYLIDIACFIYL